MTQSVSTLQRLQGRSKITLREFVAENPALHHKTSCARASRPQYHAT